MTPYEFVGYELINTTAISAIVNTRVYHGLRPEDTTVPSINYFEIEGERFSGVESVGFSINCRAGTAGAAKDLARLVVDLFAGTSGSGTYGTTNGFSVMRSSLRSEQALIPETEDNLYNAQVDVQIVYGVSTVS
jgi:hypothetical protein